jgi:polyisoprenoid-binding protein YceI
VGRQAASSKESEAGLGTRLAAGTTTAVGAFAIKRLDFKIGEGDWKDTSMVANDVQVKFKLTLAGVGAM